MRYLTTSLLFLFCLVLHNSAVAQRSVSAESIIADIDAGKSISYDNVTVTGDLDFNLVADRELEKKNNNGKQEVYRCHVRSTLSFTNCTFTGEVLGYRNEGNGNMGFWKGDDAPLYNTDFHEGVTFRDCTFEEDVNFKYSHFYEGVIFANSDFEEDAGFKYTDFSEPADFSGIEVRGDADFKYTHFSESVTFASAKFEDEAVFKYTDFPRNLIDFSNCRFDDADFKYAEFPRGVNFANTSFRGSADFKYAKLSEPSNLSGTDFGRNPDFKYTEVNGKKYFGQ